MTKGKVIWSLFDGSGIMGLPWAEAGHTVYCFNYDGADHGSYESLSARAGHKNITFVNAWIDADFEEEKVLSAYPKPDIIFAFPPCTDLSVSGSRAFASKREKDPLFQDKAARIARVAANIAERYNVPYMIENPVSVLATLWRKPDHKFSPYEYGGYLPADDIHPAFPDYINARDAYPKKTCIWCGGGFVMPDKKPVSVNDGYSVQYHKLGGKSAKTKVIRSLTPRGFARAVFEANHKQLDGKK